MQFHLNGFQMGDPDVRPCTDPGQIRPRESGPPAQVDVLVVGCGPAGLTLAAQLAAFADIETCIVDQKSGPLELGQADGVACRTVEMFNAFGFADRVLREAYWVNETTFWRTEDDATKGISRSGRVQDTEDGLSEFPHVIINQARVHQFFLDKMRQGSNRLEPCYGRRLVDLKINSEASHPVTACFEVTQADGTVMPETIRARYAVGCDGARSTVRTSLGLKLEGDSANQAWGVMDIFAVTDFPDVRLKSVINSANSGSVLLIPREGGYLFRVYVELDKLGEHERVSSRTVTIDDLIAAASKVFHPYHLDVKDVAWWSVYEIGQRLCPAFDDVSQSKGDLPIPRIFIAGDACHTHSPKAGQGMNVSMQDTFNLGWKLAAVLREQAAPELLRTYSVERQTIAKELIDFDREWAALLSAASKSAKEGDAEIASPAEVQSYFVRHGRYTAGTATQYPRSILTGVPHHQDLAPGFVIGTRFHSAPVIRLSDAKPMHLGHVIAADGRWRLFIFAQAGDARASFESIEPLCRFLAGSPSSPIVRYTPHGEATDSLIDVRAVFPVPHREFDIGLLPDLLLPVKGRLGLRDYEKVFCPSPGQDLYSLRGINSEKGCIIVVRPDQFISQVLPLSGFQELSDFFSRILIDRP